MTTGCIIQARMTSSRLPGKVLKLIDYNDRKSILEQVADRVKRAEGIDRVIIATTINRDDDPIEEIASSMGVSVFRGSENDVLQRYYLAAEKYQLQHVIRVTSDCPFLDPEILSDLISLYFREGVQYASNCIRRTYPHGMDCEIFSFDVLKWMYENTEDRFYREHVTSYVTSHQEEFSIGSLEDTEDNSGIRVTVDTVNDYLLSCVLNQMLLNMPEGTSYKTLIGCFSRYPYLSMINEGIIQKKKYPTEEEEVEAAVHLLKMQEMERAADILAAAAKK